MKTYSRKSSSYLKKAFIGSNFNEMCRLCLSEVDMVLTPIFQDSQMSYQEWIRYSVDVLVEEGDGLPPNICEECLAMVEQAYVFKKKCKASDSKLREHFQLMDSIESRITDCEFGTTTDNSDQKKETSPSICDSDTVDPGGSEVTNDHITKDVVEVDESSKDMSKDINNLKPEKSVEKDIVKPINDDNIILNEVKRYVWKNENNGEKDAVICQVVHYDIRNDFEDSNDEIENDESSVITSYSSAAILEEYSNNLKDPSDESISPNIQSMQSINEKEVGSSNQSKFIFEQVDGTEKLEGKIQEIRQLWDNDDEGGEPMEGEDETELVPEGNEVEEQDQEQEQEQEQQQQQQQQQQQLLLQPEQEQQEEEQEQENGVIIDDNEDEAEAEDENQEGLVVDVSWEDIDNQKVDSGHSGVVEVKYEENGIIRTHKVFTTENSIQFIKMEPEKHNFECFLCNKKFRLRKEMKCHLFTAHMEAARHFFCEICLKNFTSTNSLKRHMLVHTGVKPYGCEICGRKFSQTSILKRHRYTHGKKKPFECNFCQKSYTQKMNLLSHLRNHGIKSDPVSHRCKFCHKSFVHPSGLSRHLKQHKGVRFTCDQCQKSFSDSSALTRHVKSFHC